MLMFLIPDASRPSSLHLLQTKQWHQRNGQRIIRFPFSLSGPTKLLLPVLFSCYLWFTGKKKKTSFQVRTITQLSKRFFSECLIKNCLTLDTIKPPRIWFLMTYLFFLFKSMDIYERSQPYWIRLSSGAPKHTSEEHLTVYTPFYCVELAFFFLMTKETLHVSWGCRQLCWCLRPVGQTGSGHFQRCRGSTYIGWRCSRGLN